MARGSADPYRPSRRRLGDADLLAGLRERGGTASRRYLAERLDVSPLTVSRHVDHLIEAGVLKRLGYGHYGLADAREGLAEPAEELVDVLEQAGVEAHLTGLDVIGSYGHQFVRSYPHLIYVDPPALDELAFQLGAADLLPARAGSGAAQALLPNVDVARVVLLRGQPAGRSDRFGVRGLVAPVEKAWLDLVREARGGAYPIALNELGAILASLLDAGRVDQRRLSSWSREMGYQDEVAVVLDRAAPVGADAELQELAAGARG
jgi:hypothetical protein